MRSYESPDSQDFLINLVHDLRQPLGNIETSAYLLSRLLTEASPQAREQIRIIQRQVETAALLLTQATVEIRRPAAQPAVESLEFTNSATAAVT